MVTQAHLARKWGLSKTRLSQMKKEGLPLGSIAEAEAWRTAHYGGSRMQGVESPTSDPKGLPPMPNAVSVADLEREDIHGLLARIVQNEMFQWKALESAISGGNKTEIMSCERLYGEVVKYRVTMESKIDEILVRRGELVSVAESDAKTGRFLHSLRLTLKTMPARLAARCNPSDPELAKTTLTEAMERVFKKLHSWKDEPPA